MRTLTEILKESWLRKSSFSESFSVPVVIVGDEHILHAARLGMRLRNDVSGLHFEIIIGGISEPPRGICVVNHMHSAYEKFFDSFLTYGGFRRGYGAGSLNIDPRIMERWIRDISLIAKDPISFSISDIDRLSTELDSFAPVQREIDRVEKICGSINSIKSQQIDSSAPFWFFVNTIPNDVDIFETDGVGDTLLHLCDSDASSISDLVRRGIPINQKNYFGDTPFHMHINDHTVEVMRELGADPSAANCFGLHPMDLVDFDLLASDSLNEEAVRRLGESVRELSPYQSVGHFLNTKLCSAIESGDRDEIDRLLELDFPLRFPIDNRLDSEFLPAVAALERSDFYSFEKILSRDSGDKGWLLDVFDYIRGLDIDIKILKLALEYCDVFPRWHDLLGILRSPLSNEYISDYLARFCIDVNEPLVGDGNRLLLNLVVKYGLVDRVGSLLSLGANPDVMDGDGKTAWAIAANLQSERGREIVSILERYKLKQSTLDSRVEHDDSLGM